MPESTRDKFNELVEIVARLRGPDGCPWDRQQTHQSLKPMMIEEAYEVLEAIDEGDDEELMGELGDLLLQVVFHSQLAEEEGRFTMADVLERISSKMVRRHPHVFGEERAATSSEVLRNWEALKEAELAAKGKGNGATSMLDSVSAALPAVMEAFQVTTKVSRVGFDWPDVASVVQKLDEEIAEMKEVVSDVGGSFDHRRAEEEIGDVMFALVNLARRLGVDPESSLKRSNRKFRRRFRHIEDSLREQDRRPADADPEELMDLWREAKLKEGADPGPEAI